MSANETVDNFDEAALDAIFNELEAQNELLPDETKSVETESAFPDDTPSELDKEITDEAIQDAIEDEAVISIAENLAVEQVEQMKTEKFNAEQQVDLEEVFQEVKSEIENTIDDQVELASIQEDIMVEVFEDPNVEDAPNEPVETNAVEEVEAPVEVAVQTKSIPEFEPKPTPVKSKSEPELVKLFELKYAPDVEAFQRDIAFTDATLDIAMRTQASLAAYQNEKAARANAQASRAKLNFESKEALLYEAYRKHFITTKEKVTEKAIENAVRKDSRWIKAKEILIEAEMYADIHRGFVFALRDRNDMLIQRGAANRQERNGQLRMSEAQHQADIYSAGANAARNAMQTKGV